MYLHLRLVLTVKNILLIKTKFVLHSNEQVPKLELVYATGFIHFHRQPAMKETLILY